MDSWYRARRPQILGLLVVAALGARAVVALIDRGDRPTSVVAGADPAATTPASTTATTLAIEFVAGQPLGTRLDFTVPPGWTTLFAQGERMVVATRPLSEADRTLALLARNDSAFSTAFPPDAVVVVVGGDPVEAKYLGGPGEATIAPGPAYALGPERVLAGGIRVRRGDVPQSIVKIASYAGPSAPAARLAEADTIAGGIRLVRTGDPSVRPPPPPEGSRPGLPTGPLPVAEAGLPEVARTSASGSTLVLVAGQDCAYLRWVDAQTSLPGYQPLAGACGARPAGTTIRAVGQPVRVMRGPDTSPSTVTIFRSGAGVARFTARLVDGRMVPASIGADGWGLVAGDADVVAVSPIDAQGRTLAEQVVG